MNNWCICWFSTHSFTGNFNFQRAHCVTYLYVIRLLKVNVSEYVSTHIFPDITALKMQMYLGDSSNALIVMEDISKKLY